MREDNAYRHNAISFCKKVNDCLPRLSRSLTSFKELVGTNFNVLLLFRKFTFIHEILFILLRKTKYNSKYLERHINIYKLCKTYYVHL